MKRIILLTIITFFSVLAATSAQGWQRLYGKKNVIERGRYITRTADGGFLVRASDDVDSTRSTLFRLDAEGQIVWKYAFTAYYTSEGPTFVNDEGDIFTTCFDSLYKFDARGRKLFQVFSGNQIIIGLQSNGIITAVIPDYSFLALKKFDFNGNLIWEEEQPANDESIRSAGILPDGRIVTLRYKNQVFQQSLVHVYDTTVYPQMLKTFANGNLYDLIIGSDGNILLSGCTVNGQTAEKNTVYLKKMTPEGDMIYETEYDIAPTDVVTQPIPLPGGKTVLIGTTWYDAIEKPRLYCIDSTGNELWKNIFDPVFATEIREGVSNPDGSFVVTGYSKEKPLGVGEISDVIVWKFDSEGQMYANRLQGRLVRDENLDCQPALTEPGIPGWKTAANNLISVSDRDGKFELQLDSGTTYLGIYPEGSYWQVCPGFDSITFNGSLLADTIEIPVQALADCPQMTVSIGFQRLRRCFENTATVKWCNIGTQASDNTRILVVLPPELDYTGATWPLAQAHGDSLWFDIGWVDINACGEFQLRAVVDCDSTVLNQALCTSAHIYPDSFCLTPSQWSGAHIEVTASCIGDSLVKFHLQNTGNAPTSPDLEYVIIEDQVVLKQMDFALGIGGEMEILQPILNGSLYRIEADQEPFHPGYSIPSAWVEGCGLPGNEGLSLQYSVDDADLFTDTDCLRVTGSYDPNDKTGFPEGFKDDHLIERNTELTYKIRFQNTGTDTAFTVIIRDTLSDWLDPLTIRQEAASHNFTWDIAEGNILKFTFNNILLPDSNTNLEGSQGFVQFRIAQQPDLDLGTVIHNRAAIYFDFNEPVITNETWHTIGEAFILVKTDVPVSKGGLLLSVQPNPVQATAQFIFAENVSGTLYLYGLDCRILRQEQVNGHTYHFERGDLPAGIYPFEVLNNRGTNISGKILLR